MIGDKLISLWLKAKKGICVVGVACMLTTSLGTSSLAQKKNTNKPAAQPEQPQKSGPSKTASDSEPETPPSHSAKTKVVMVTDFDARGIIRWWQGNWDIGSLFSNSIIGPLSRTPSYEVVERGRMRDLINEQGLTETERFSQPKITKIGRLLGADYILFGDLQDFSRKKGKNPFVKETQVSISLSARLVSIATGKVYKSTEVTYLSPKEKDYFSFGEKEVNPNDPEFLQSIFGKAIAQAAVQTVAQLTGEQQPASAMAPAPANNVGAAKPSSGGVAESGLIADVTGNTVVINVGSAQGVKVGNFFAVVKVVKEVRDPKDPSKIILRKTEEVARIKITSVQSGASEGTVVSGKTDSLQVGVEVFRIN